MSSIPISPRLPDGALSDTTPPSLPDGALVDTAPLRLRESTHDAEEAARLREGVRTAAEWINNGRDRRQVARLLNTLAAGGSVTSDATARDERKEHIYKEYLKNPIPRPPYWDWEREYLKGKE